MQVLAAVNLQREGKDKRNIATIFTRRFCNTLGNMSFEGSMLWLHDYWLPVFFSGNYICSVLNFVEQSHTMTSRFTCSVCFPTQASAYYFVFKGPAEEQLLLLKEASSVAVCSYSCLANVCRKPLCLAIAVAWIEI